MSSFSRRFRPSLAAVAVTLALSCALVPATPISAALLESAVTPVEITIPAFAPREDISVVYRTRMTIEYLPSGMAHRPAMTQHGDFIRKVDYRRQADGTFRQTWHLSADLPADADPALTYRANDLYRDSLAAYGLDRLDLAADAAGLAVRVDNIAEIKARLEAAAAALKPAAGTVAPRPTTLDRVSALIERAPLTVATFLIPELDSLQSPQNAVAGTFEVGTEWPIDWSDTSQSLPIRHTGGGRVEAYDADAGTVTLAWTTRTSPPEAALVLAGGRRDSDGSEVLSDAVKDQLSGLSETSEHRHVVSLKTGMVREMTTVISTDTIIGRMRVTFRTTCTGC